MLVIGMFSWWYTAGWQRLWRILVRRLLGVVDFFSITLLLKTLFAPFRQISVGQVRGSVGVQLRAWFDRQISRAIGAMVRLAVIAFGLIALVTMLAVSALIFLLWPLLPLAPLLAVILMIGVA